MRIWVFYFVTPSGSVTRNFRIRPRTDTASNTRTTELLVLFYQK